LLDLTHYSRFRYLSRYQLLRAEIAIVPGETRHAQQWAEEAQAFAEVITAWLRGY
jgi:hypothetical protein